MKTITAEQERNLDHFVSHEVRLCVSSTVALLQRQVESLPEYEDELFDSATGRPDYLSAAQDRGWHMNHDGTGFRNDKLNAMHAVDSWEELCEVEDLDVFDYLSEVYEHWCVTPWLAEQLIAHDERVIEDLCGLSWVWCRTTTGQAIAMDGVIQEIYAETCI